MKVIEPIAKIISPREDEYSDLAMHIEAAGRTCYKSEPAKLPDNNFMFGFARKMLNNGHLAMLEFADVIVRIVCDRGVSHELVRHRIASYAQESTRYCNYSKDKFGNKCTFIRPVFWKEGSPEYHMWKNAMQHSEDAYFKLLENGASAQEARSVLPNSLKTEIVVKMNVREWLHFFNLRCDVKAHPQMRQIAISLLILFHTYIPVLFEQEYNYLYDNQMNEFVLKVISDTYEQIERGEAFDVY